MIFVLGIIIFLIFLIFFTLMNTDTNFVEQEKGNAQDFFLYLVVFFSLAFVAFGEGSILFGLVDKFFNNKAPNMLPAFNQGVVKFGIAALIIAGPIFMVISRIILKRIAEQKISLESKVRKWLTYLVLFFAAATIIGDLITLVVNFLEGDYTASFLLKVLVVLLIAGGIFGYYFWDMRRKEISSKINKMAASVFVAAILLTLISGFFIIDSPAVSRQKKIDQEIVNSLQSVDSSVQNYFTETGKLPQKIEVLGQTKFSVRTQDIKGFEYKIENESSYQLCADFERANFEDPRTVYDYSSIEDWKHAAGKHCFTRIAIKKDPISLPQTK